MNLLGKIVFIILFLFIFQSGETAFGADITHEYILETNDIVDLANDYPLDVLDAIDSESIYKIRIEKDTDDVRKTLENDARVLSLSENSLIYIAPIQMPFRFSMQTANSGNWGFQSMNFPGGLVSAENIDVAVLDTGVDTNHPLLKDSIKLGFDAINQTSIEDENGHGTYVSGIIAIDMPQIKIIPVKVLDKNGFGDMYTFISGIYYAIENNVDIINMSLGIKADLPLVKAAILDADEKGITLIAATGNDGHAYLQYPAKYKEVIAVGAYDINEKRAKFSQYGEGLAFMAPGVEVRSAWLMDTYRLESGTSVATPFITKAVALLKSQNKSLSNVEIKNILVAASQPIAGDFKKEFGYGKVDVEKALTLANMKRNTYTYLPKKIHISSMKEWQIKMSLNINKELFDSSLIHVLDSNGNEIKVEIQLDDTDLKQIKVLPPTNGYESRHVYEIKIEKGLISDTGKVTNKAVKMEFVVE